MSRSRSTQQQPGTYTHEQLGALLRPASRADLQQLVSAADFMSRVFQANEVPYAFMGGFALRLRGSDRETRDVDIAVGCTMLRLIEVLSAQTRIRRPAGPTSGVMRVFVLVGGQLNPGVPELWVGVDLIFRGSHGAPDHVQNSSEPMTFNTNAGQMQFPVIDLLNALASKLSAYYTRQSRNDFNDIGFLVTKYEGQVYAIRTQLKATHTQYFVESFAQLSGSQSQTEHLKRTLGVA